MVRKMVMCAALAAVTTTLLCAAEVKETVHLVVTGGPNAGTYDASSDRGGCSYGLAAPGAWGNQLSNPKDKDPKHFNSLQLIVPNAKGAARGTKDFLLVVGFGPLLHRGAEYKIETRAGQAKSGSGTVSVIDKGATGTVSFDATAAGGVKLHGTIDCRSVIRAPR